MKASPALRRLFEPQVEQFGLAPASDTPLGCGTLFSGDTACAHGWLWVCGIDDSCLVAVHDINLTRDLTLQEEGADALCMASMTAQTIATWFDRHDTTGVPTSPRENVVAFSQDRRPTEGLLRAGTRHASVSVTCKPRFFEQHGVGNLYRMLDRGLTRYRGDAEGCLTYDLPVSLRSSLRTLASPLTRENTRAEHLVRSQVARAVEALVRHMRAVEEARRDAGSLEQILLVARTQNYLDGNLDRLVGIDELCDRLHVGRTRLCSAFKAETGEGLASWARARRIERAKELLSEGRLPVAEVARAVGYERPSSFDDLFRREVGCSPRAWAAQRG